MSRIGSQGLVAMFHGPEYSGKAVIAEDTCHNGAVCMPVLHLAMAFHSIGYSILAYPPAPVLILVHCRSKLLDRARTPMDQATSG